MARGLRWAAGLALAGVAALWLHLAVAQQRGSRDYLDAELRARVEELKRDAATAPTTAANLVRRGPALWDWLNAYALSGGTTPVNATLYFRPVFEAIAALEGRLEEPAPINESGGSALDDLIAELKLKDEIPGALGKIEIVSAGPFVADTDQTIELTWTVGEAGMATGGSLLLGKQLMSDQAAVQLEDPAAPNYVSIRSSNRAARFEPAEVPLSGMHGGFRGAVRMPAFRLDSGRLGAGDTVTIAFGDRSGGSPGFRIQSFQNDQAILPVYLDLEGEGKYLTPDWPGFGVKGGAAEAVRVIAQSVVKPGEAFELFIRTEDRYVNRASSGIPGYEVLLNGQPFRKIPAEPRGFSLLTGITLAEAGVYRFEVRTEDGALAALSNPVWVRANPPYRVYWGETHAHTGMAEGQGSIEEFYRYGREEARLDFLGLSEHDIWLDEAEWRRMTEAVRRYYDPGKFVTFLGYEWTVGRSGGGHHNVFFRDTAGQWARSQFAFSLSRLYQQLREQNDTRNVLIIPHAHQAGDWRRNDPAMERLIEIMSMHGTFEWFGNRYLQSGADVGFIAASDNHRSRPGLTGTGSSGSLTQIGGLAAALAEEKTSGSIFDALRARAAYAVTSADRILLDVTVAGEPMGRRVGDDAERKLDIRVMGTAALTEVAVIKNGETVFSKRPSAGAVRDHVTALLGFDSSSDPIIRDNPRGYRRWKGTIEVEGARLAGFSAAAFDNRYIETAERDPSSPNRLRFYVETRGRADLLRLELDGVSPATRIVVALEATREYAASPPKITPYALIPAARVELPFREISDGWLERELRSGKNTDSISLQLLSDAPALDFSTAFVDAGDALPGDYYYVRVKQANGAWAWSSPIRVGGEAAQ